MACLTLHNYQAASARSGIIKRKNDSFNHDAPKSGLAEYFHIGPGFGLVEINGKEITVKTYETEGKILDTFVLLK